MRAQTQLSLCMLLLLGCPRRAPNPAPALPVEASPSAPGIAPCDASVEEEFGPQGGWVLALQPVDRGPVMRSGVLASISAITEALEDEALSGGRQVRSLTNVPLALPKGASVEFTTLGESGQDLSRLPLLNDALRSIEFSVGDVIDGSGTRAFVHLPVEAFQDGVAMIPALLAEHVSILTGALDPSGDEDRKAYEEIAGRGPSSSYLAITLTPPPDMDMRDPEALRALDQLQTRLEAQAEVAQTFSVVDDIKMTRRNVHDGTLGWAVIPDRRAEIKQLLTVFELSGKSEIFGRRVTRGGSQALLRVHLRSISPAEFNELGARIPRLAEGLKLGSMGICGAWRGVRPATPIEKNGE